MERKKGNGTGKLERGAKALGKRVARRIPVIHRAKPPGTAPGTLLADPRAEPPTISILAFGPEECVQETVAEVDEVQRFLNQWPIVWINVDGLGDIDVVSRLGEMFGVHRLALEDVVNVHQRAKVEPYGDQLFIVARMVHLNQTLATEQLSLFLGATYVLTFQEHQGDSFDLVRERIRAGRGLIRSARADYLAYALLDALIDAYFPVVERFGEQLEEIENELMRDPRPELMRRIHQIKRELLMLRRAIWPHREAINALIREDGSAISPETRIYLRDCYDHTIQLLDMVETYRELSVGLLDYYMSHVSNRMNEVMKVLTVFASIFIPLTFLVGIYGMNFSNMPELDWPFAYPLLLAVMLAVGVGMWLYFRKKGWI